MLACRALALARLTSSSWIRTAWYRGKVTAMLTRRPVSRTSNTLARMMRRSALSRRFIRKAADGATVIAVLSAAKAGCMQQSDRLSLMPCQCLDGSVASGVPQACRQGAQAVERQFEMLGFAGNDQPAGQTLFCLPAQAIEWRFSFKARNQPVQGLAIQ